MGRRTTTTTTTIIALGLLVASPLMARRLTTTQMRENTIRINALELEEPAPEPIPAPEPEPAPEPQVWAFDSGRLNFDFDKSLGMRRAVAVRDKLIEFGLDPARIIGVESRGESEPIAPNDTEQGRFENRRIEFKATK